MGGYLTNGMILIDFAPLAKRRWIDLLNEGFRYSK